MSREAAREAANDRVKATGLWVEGIDSKHNAGDTDWPDMSPRPKAEVAKYGGYGLRPVHATRGVRNVIGFQFTIRPVGVWNIRGVKFDATRQKEGKVWWVQGTNIHVDKDHSFPHRNEWPNDDGNDADETATKNGPTSSGHFYSTDPPGAKSRRTSGLDLYVMRKNFYEFMRVSLNGMRPIGNAVRGSRCSPKYKWQVRHRLEDNGAGIWQRVGGNANNHIKSVDTFDPIGAAP